MLCFYSLEENRLSVDERRAWQRADKQFVSKQMTTPDGSQIPGQYLNLSWQGT
jgi:hypothetical protein